MKQIKTLLGVSLTAIAVLAAMAPEVAQANPHRVCHWNHFHTHRVCHWVR